MKAEWHRNTNGNDILVCGPIVCELFKVDGFNDIEQGRFCEFRFIDPHIIIKGDEKKQAVRVLLRNRLMEAGKLLLEMDEEGKK